MRFTLERRLNLILEKTSQVPYFTNMHSVLAALEIQVRDDDWYLSNIPDAAAAFTRVFSDVRPLSGAMRKYLSWLHRQPGCGQVRYFRPLDL